MIGSVGDHVSGPEPIATAVGGAGELAGSVIDSPSHVAILEPVTITVGGIRDWQAVSHTEGGSGEITVCCFLVV